ncbi:MAG: replication-associated recombination protein A [Bacillota bacterium]|nr:replication-associated recombination protein A [Bacillota bacterium]
MSLFEGGAAARQAMPLAARLRPRNLDEFIGQEHLIGQGRLLRRLAEERRLVSLIFYGPPGTGKTTLARLLAGASGAYFEQLNAVTAGVADVRRVIQEAADRLHLHGQRTVLFIDEIHRFNRAQQDALLKAVEEGVLIFIGATAENPFYEVVSPLISRARVFRFEPLTEADLERILDLALSDERGLGRERIEVEPEARRHLIRVSGGDARALLNALELAALAAQPGADGRRLITRQLAEEATQVRALRYDRAGDYHYDAISAYIKSLRGSDPDAALYWMVRMLEAGEDPLFIARRLVIQAAEDVGNADPQALLMAVSAFLAVERVGLPEGKIPLAQATIYVATAPKSNAAYLALRAAEEAVRSGPTAEVPLHLRDASHPGVRAQLGHGEGYLYPHDFPGAYVIQQYLPSALQGRRFYEPSDRGYEGRIRERLEKQDFTR